MKILILAAFAATLLFSVLAEEPPRVADAKLTPAHAAKWKEINADVKSRNEEMERAELVYLRAKMAYQEAQAAGGASLAKMQQEANCANCFPQTAPDGSLVWPKLPQVPKTEQTKENSKR